MAEFKGKNGHWVTTESGSHIFIESDGTFEEAVEKAFGKGSSKKYKKGREEILELGPVDEDLKGLFDVASPQEAANMMGKPVRENGKIYRPESKKDDEKEKIVNGYVIGKSADGKFTVYNNEGHFEEDKNNFYNTEEEAIERAKSLKKGIAIDDEYVEADEDEFDRDLEAAFKKHGADEDAILDELRANKKDYGMSNGDLQGVVESYVERHFDDDFEEEFKDENTKDAPKNQKGPMSFEEAKKYIKKTTGGDLTEDVYNEILRLGGKK